MMRSLVLAVLVLVAGSVPAAETCDVCVVGGGVAGIAAAISAGRRGVRTVLLEQGFQVGGNMTSGGVNWPGLFHAGPRQVIAGCGWSLVTNCVALSGGILQDFSKDVGHEHWRRQIRVNVPLFVALAEEELRKAKVEIRYHAAPVKAEQVGSGWRLQIAAAGELDDISARVLVDATGNGALSALCGAERMRDPNACQPGSFSYLIDPGAKSCDLDLVLLERLREKAIGEGRLLRSDICRGLKFLIDESNTVLSGFAKGPDHGTTIANYIEKADNSTASLRTDTNLRGRASMLRVYRFLRTLPGLENARLVSAFPEVGVRETWRVVGEHLLTGEEYASGCVFPDSVCYSYYPIDIHDVKKGVNPRHLKAGVAPTIPLRSLTVKGVKNLLVAGRCISCDRVAHSALRVQVSCMATGQAAGEAAALAAEQACEVRDLSVEQVKARLRQSGAIVP